MRVLIVEDDLTGRQLLVQMLSAKASCDQAEDGVQAVQAVKESLQANEPYDLVTLDLMMPNMDGHETLDQIRSLEAKKGIALGDGAKIIMTTALSDSKNIMKAFRSSCEAYLVKPIRRDKLFDQMKELGLDVNSQAA